MNIKRNRIRRHGAIALEMWLILTMMVPLAIGTLDLGLAVFRFHVVSIAARQGARRAIVHGSMANVLGSWGPAAIDVPASANGIPIVDGALDGIQSLLVGCDLSQTRIQVDWLDEGNDLEQRVRVTVSSPYSAVLAGFRNFWTNEVIITNHTLTASSTMPIAH